MQGVLIRLSFEDAMASWPNPAVMVQEAQHVRDSSPSYGTPATPGSKSRLVKLLLRS